MDNQRTGSSDRINPDRYFHVMNQGWYIYTREGVRGPYDKRNDAEDLISTVIGGTDDPSENDINDSWRM
ncbi:MAG: hypothetical protein ACC657_04000 [Thiohalomonadales bacterium]